MNSRMKFDFSSVTLPSHESPIPQGGKPGTSFLYELMIGDEVVYVGQTSSPYSRIKNHARDGKHFDSVCIYEHKKTEINDIEACAIMELKPLLNKNLPKNNAFVSARSVASMILRAMINSGVVDTTTKSLSVGDGWTHCYVRSEIAESILSAVDEALCKSSALDMKVSELVALGEGK